DKALQEGKKEQKLVVYSTGGGEIRALGTAFQKKYGISVEPIIARGAEVTARVSAERKAGLYLVDLYLGGSGTAMVDWKGMGILTPLEPVLILPEVLDPKVWYGGHLLFLDKDKTVLKALAYANVPMVINTTMVKPDEIKSYKDLLLPKWKGKILMNDPTTRGTGGKTAATLGLELMGFDYLEALAKQEPMILRNERQQVEWVSQGKYPVLLSPLTTPLAEFIKAGAPIKEVIPIEGSHYTGGVGNIAMVQNAPHPKAAKLFINWYLSKEGQSIMSQETLNPSARLDVSTEGMNETRLHKPGDKYVDSDTEEFLDRYTPLLTGKLLDIFGPLMK
ncbi:MAG: extracellular solute-binding protein, partial [Dehalococcoidia bacterium]|nr:extracellular solute-binding protein [Dehalococcoidia bacterium]